MLENGVSRMPAAATAASRRCPACASPTTSALPGPGAAVRHGQPRCWRRQARRQLHGDAGQPDARAPYKIAENDFTATGGDGYPNFASRMTTQDIMEQVVADYITAARVAWSARSSSAASPAPTATRPHPLARLDRRNRSQSTRRAGGATPARSEPAMLMAAALAAASGCAAVSATGAHEGGPRLILEPTGSTRAESLVDPRRGPCRATRRCRSALVGGMPGRADLVARSRRDGAGHMSRVVGDHGSRPMSGSARTRSSGRRRRPATPIRGRACDLEWSHRSSIGRRCAAGPGRGPPSAAAAGVGPPSSGRTSRVSSPSAPAAPVASAGSPLRPLADPSGAGQVDLVPVVALALAVGGLGLLVWRTRRSAASQTRSVDLP